MAYTCGASIHPIPTSPHDGYHYADRAKVEAQINEHTRAIMVTNPGNPTGAVLTPEEMRMMVDIAKEHDLFIIGDEAYREFVYAGEPLQSMGQFEDAAENVIVIDTVSKRFSACGARIGCMISRNKELMAQAMKYAQCRLSVPTIDQVAAAALYSVGPDYFAAVREEYKRRRDTVIRKLHEIPGVVCECPRRRLLRHGCPARGRCRRLPEVAAGGVRRQRRYRDVRPRRALLRHPRQGQERDPHCLRAEAGGSGACHGPAGQGHRRLQRPLTFRQLPAPAGSCVFRSAVVQYPCMSKKFPKRSFFMNEELKNILSRVDHTLLSQTATWAEIRAICDDGVKYGCASVCIPASYVKQAAEYVDGKIAICTVIGFPNGYDTTAAKCFEAADAVKNGASEIDMVINIGWVKDGLYDRVLEEIKAVKDALRRQAAEGHH